MIPGMNNKQMQRMMKQMGMKQKDIDASEVVIRCPDKEIVISNPSVARVEMMGQETWQVSGTATERAADSKPEISEDDVQTVMEQAGVDEDAARKAIDEHDGDLAEAIMSLQE